MRKFLFLFICLLAASSFAENGIKVKVNNNIIVTYTNDTLPLAIDTVEDGYYIYKDSCLYNLIGNKIFPKQLSNTCISNTRVLN